MQQNTAAAATAQHPAPVQFALAVNVRPGDKLKADGGFDCIREGSPLTVYADKNKRGVGRLYVLCDHNRHYLDGSIGDHGELVGFSPA